MTTQASTSVVKNGAVTSPKLADQTDITWTEGAAPATPASGEVVLYAKTDGLLYSKDDTGQEDQVSGVRVLSGTFTRDATTASGTQAITGLGFRPRGIVGVSGVISGASAHCTFSCSQSVGVGAGAGLQLSAGLPYASGNLILAGSGGGDYQIGNVTSWDADGFTINWTKVGSPTGTINVSYTVFR